MARCCAVPAATVAADARTTSLLSHFDASWELAGKSNAAGAQPEWNWPWWAMVADAGAAGRAGVARLPQLAARRPRGRRWPCACGRSPRSSSTSPPVGTFPYHAFQGLALPLAILAVQGVVSVWPHPAAHRRRCARADDRARHSRTSSQVSVELDPRRRRPVLRLPRRGARAQGARGRPAAGRRAQLLLRRLHGPLPHRPRDLHRRRSRGRRTGSSASSSRTACSRGRCAGRRRAGSSRSTNARWIFEDCRPGLAQPRAGAAPAAGRASSDSAARRSTSCASARRWRGSRGRRTPDRSGPRRPRPRRGAAATTAEGEALYRALGFTSLGFGRTWWHGRS